MPSIFRAAKTGSERFDFATPVRVSRTSDGDRIQPQVLTSVQYEMENSPFFYLRLSPDASAVTNDYSVRNKRSTRDPQHNLFQSPLSHDGQ